MTRHDKRKQREAAKRRGAARRGKIKSVSPRTVEEFFAMSGQDQDFWGDVGRIATEVKGGASLSQSARKYRRGPRKVRQAAPAAFRKLKNGRYAAKANDHLLRVLVIPNRRGLSEIGVGDSRQASLLGRYWSAVERYRDTGDASALREFGGKYIIDVSEKRVQLMTNPRELDRLGSAGVLSFESLYARVA